MQKEHQSIVDEMIARAGRETKKRGPSPEQISMAEAIFKILGSEAFLGLLVKNDRLARSYFEIELVDAKIDNKPKSTLTETVILAVGRKETDPDELTYELKGKVWMAETFQGKSKEKDGDEVYLIIRNSYAADGFDTIEDLQLFGGSDWGAHLVRTFDGPKALADAHGKVVGKILGELQKAAGFKPKEPRRKQK